MEEAGVPGENHRPWASNLLTLSLPAASWVHPFCNLQSRARTHAVLMIGLECFVVYSNTQSAMKTGKMGASSVMHVADHCANQKTCYSYSTPVSSAKI